MSFAFDDDAAERRRHPRHSGKHKSKDRLAHDLKPPTVSALVLSQQGSRIELDLDGTTVFAQCRVPGVVPGDLVQLKGDAWNRLVVSVSPRTTELRRMGPDGRKIKPIAANLDIGVVVTTVTDPAFKPRLIDRYLAAFWRGGMKPLIVLNKVDLGTADELAHARSELEAFAAVGVAWFEVSCSTGDGIEPLREALAGKLSVLVGHSGVGKSSLMNALCGHPIAETGHVNEDTGKGRHTTTTSHLRVLPGGARVIDTPGVRTFAVDFESAEEVEAAFPEFARHARRCEPGCRHQGEEGCGVGEAMARGEIHPGRYKAYRGLLTETTGEPDPTFGGFVCGHCGADVVPEGAGSGHRNHCPRCLHSSHLDTRPGDRASGCGGDMEPVAVWVRRGGEWAIIHRCRRCGAFSSNRIAADDNQFVLLSLGARALANPPFPVDRLDQEVV